MYNKIITFLDRYDIIYIKKQFGLRQKHSSHHAFITNNKISGSWGHCDWNIFRYKKGIRCS